MNSAVQSPPIAVGGRRVPTWALALPVAVVLLATSAGVAMVLAGRSSQTVWVEASHARVGGAAPNFTSLDLSGKKVSAADFHGRPVLMTFWATWCTVCRDELPALQGLQEQYRSAGLAVLALNYRESSGDRMRQYLAGLGVQLQSVIDPDGSIGAAYGVNVGLPVNVLVDRAGTVVQIMIGQQPVTTIDAAIRQVISN